MALQVTFSDASRSIARTKRKNSIFDPMTKRRITFAATSLPAHFHPRFHPTGGIQLAEMTNRNFPEHRSIQSGSDESGEHEFVLSNRADWPERHCDRLGAAEAVSLHTRERGAGALRSFPRNPTD